MRSDRTTLPMQPHPSAMQQAVRCSLWHAARQQCPRHRPSQDFNVDVVCRIASMAYCGCATVGGKCRWFFWLLFWAATIGVNPAASMIVHFLVECILLFRVQLLPNSATLPEVDCSSTSAGAFIYQSPGFATTPLIVLYSLTVARTCRPAYNSHL